MSLHRSPFALVSYAASLTALTALTAMAGPVSAGSLAGIDGQLRETSFRRDVSMYANRVVVVDTQHVIAAKSEAQPISLNYQFELPLEAAIVALEITQKGKTSRAVAIDSDAAVRRLPNANGATPDLALLHETGGDAEMARFQLVVTGINRSKATTIKIRWLMPTQINASVVTAELPTRSAGTGLRGIELYARLAKDRSGSLRDLRVNGVAASPRTETPIDQALKTLRLEARLKASTKSARRGVRLETNTQHLGGNIYALTVLAMNAAPTNNATEFDNLVIAVDVSRSMTKRGLEAAARLAEAVLSRAGSAHVEVLLYDREARSLLNGLTPIKRETLGRASAAITASALRNGSDLGAALHAASAALSKPQAQTRSKAARASGDRSSAIVVISDGQAPTRIDTAALRSALGDRVFADTIVFAIDLAADGVPLPRTPGRVLADLILATGGRAFAVRTSDVSKTARAIAAALGPSPQLGALTINVNGTPLRDAGIPRTLAPGSGFFATTLWVGERAPRSIKLGGVRGGNRVEASAQTLRWPASTASALALRHVTVEAIKELTTRVGGAAIDESRKAGEARAISRVGKTVAVVSPSLSLVIPNPGSAFARERLAFAKRWGTELYRRSPSAVELSRSFIGRYRAPKRAPRAAVKVLARAGGLDRGSIGRAIRTQLFRRVRHCYEKALKRDSKLRGTARVRFEIGRAEVAHASLADSDGLPVALRQCIVNAAYDLKAPSAPNDASTTYVVHYPFRLRPGKKGAQIDRGAPSADPLDGL